MNNNCDITQDPAYITSIDTQNSYLYAINKLLLEQTNNYALKAGGTIQDNGIVTGGTIVWQPSKQDGSVSYPCPSGLKCWEGIPKISTKEECKARSTYTVDVPPGYKDGKGGWYLNWIPSSENGQQGDCYPGNYFFRHKCENNFLDDGDSSRGKGLLQWDDDTNRCLMTKAYCSVYGDNVYDDGNGGDKPGGTCELTTGKMVSDAIFGKTITSFFSGDC